MLVSTTPHAVAHTPVPTPVPTPAPTHVHIPVMLTFYAMCDPLLDLASDDPGQMVWLENTRGNGTAWVRHPVKTNVNGFDFALGADLDNDGDVDLLSANTYEDTVACYINDGYQNFSEVHPHTSLRARAQSL